MVCMKLSDKKLEGVRVRFCWEEECVRKGAEGGKVSGELEMNG